MNTENDTMSAAEMLAKKTNTAKLRENVRLTEQDIRGIKSRWLDKVSRETV